jgi:hypothetical protein
MGGDSPYHIQMFSVLRQIDVNVAVRRVIGDEIKSVLSPADDRLDQESLAQFECEYSVPEDVVRSVDDNQVGALQSRLHTGTTNAQGHDILWVASQLLGKPLAIEG